jgi:RNA polymerase sigma factor (sigma-70 family)
MRREEIYSRRIEYIHGNPQYILSFASFDGLKETVVSKAVYDLVDELRLEDRRILNQISRHNEYLALSDEGIYSRAFHRPKPLEDVVCDRMLVEQAVAAIRTLKPAQARRFVLRHIYGMTYAAIARMEGVSTEAVRQSVAKTARKIRRQLKL